MLMMLEAERLNMQLYTPKMLVVCIRTNNSMVEVRFEYFNASNAYEESVHFGRSQTKMKLDLSQTENYSDEVKNGWMHGINWSGISILIERCCFVLEYYHVICNV